MPTNSVERLEIRRVRRQGAAVVEAAMILPLLVILTLGVIDISQYIGLAQVVVNASRESARVASRAEVNSLTEVETAAKQYFGDMFPKLSTESLDSAIEVVISDSAGGVISDLANVETGAQLSVFLKFDFTQIRWLKGVDYWTGSADQAFTVFRKE